MSSTVLITQTFPPAHGGIERFLYEIACRVPDICVLAPALKAGEREVSAPFQLVRTPFYFVQFRPRWVRLFIAAMKLVRKRRPRHIVINDILPVGIVGYALSVVFRVPFSVIVHGLDIASVRNSWKKRIVVRYILRRANKIITNSEYTRSLVLRYGVSEDVCMIVHPGVSQELFSIQPAHGGSRTIDMYNLASKRIICTVGRLVRRKGHAQFLHVVSRLRIDFPDIHYLIIGDGPERKTIEAEVRKLGISKYVTLTGELPDTEIRELFTRTHLFVFTPLSPGADGDVEGYGMVVVESQASGIPVVATATGGVREAAGGETSALLVPPEDWDAVTDACARLLVDKELHMRLSTSGRAHAATRTWDKTIAPLLSFLRHSK